MANTGGKDVGVSTALRAFEATYKAACKRHDIIPYRPLLNALQQAQENFSRFERVLLTGPSVEGAAVRAMAECLASHAPVCGLCCYGCSIGDEGLAAIACLLRSSASRWWRGCRLSTIELCADGRSPPLQALKTKDMLAAPGSALSSSAGQVLRSLTGSAGAGSLVQVQSAGGVVNRAESSSSGGSNRPRSAAAVSGVTSVQQQKDTHTTDASCALHVQALQRPSSASPCRAHRYKQHSPIGVCPPVPAHLQLNFPTHQQLEQQSLAERVGPLDHIQYRSPPPRPAVVIGRWVLDETMQSWRQQQQEQQQTQELCQYQRPMHHPSINGCRGEHLAAAGEAQVPAQQQQDQQQVLQSQLQHLDEQQQCQAAAGSQQEKDPRFGAGALQELSLGLGVAGLVLSRLVLDHTMIGDMGISILATGLSKCQSLKHISLCDCHIGPLGIKNFAAACIPRNAAAASTNLSWSSNGSATGNSRLHDGNTNTAAGGAEHNISSSSSGILCLEVLQLSGNPITAVGLQHLTPLLRSMQSLKVLGLADIGVTDHDKIQLQALVHAVSSGPKQLEQLDFDANYIGDRAASHLLTLLSSNPSLLLLKLTPRISPEVMLQLTTLMEQNLKAAKTAKTRKPHKAK